MSDLSLGVVGLGIMGRNLALNALDAGVAVAGTDLGAPAVEGFSEEAGGRELISTSDPTAFLDALPSPRALLVMVPAGAPVDAVLKSFMPRLTPGDVLVDGGNSFFRDTERRQAEMEAAGLHFFGMGVSGGEEGARHGPSMMPGGPMDAYARLAPVLDRMAAKVNGEPCVAHVGEGAAGHYVKMVHNGIEYALMQLLSEAYDLLKRGCGLSNDAIGDLFAQWNEGRLQSFLVEITADIFRQPDTVEVPVDENPDAAAEPVVTGTAAMAAGADAQPHDKTARRFLLDVISDRAAQKGTGKWTSQDALDLGVPIPTIDAAVAARYLSALKDERVAASDLLGKPAHAADDPKKLADDLCDALHAAFLVTYAQGFALLRRASDAYSFGYNPEVTARIWRGGCIIRAQMLETFREAFADAPDAPNLLVTPPVAERLSGHQGPLRSAVAAGVASGIPLPALSSALAYLDSYRSAWLPANLVQAQRDYFGAHTFQRTDREGTFHVQWSPAGL